MRILFVLDSVENAASANALMARRLAAALCAAGHSVHLLELWDGQHAPPAQPGCTAHRLCFADEYRMNEALEYGRRGGTPIPRRLARLVCRPDAAAAAFRQLVLHRPRREVDTRREVERLDARFRFDVVCAVCAPYRSAFALEKARISAKKAIWQLDPYAACQDYSAPGGYARELRLLDALDAAFITPQAAGDYQPGMPLAAEAAKVHPLHFPSMVPPAAPQAVGGRRRCVFCGSLYPGVREPGFALELFCALGADSGWTLAAYGGGWQCFEPEAARARAVLGSRLELHGTVSADEARAATAGADVLLNIGNTTENQLPSKLFDYFAAGKPVLHLCAARQDPALAYLARYPLSLVLRPGQSGAADTLRQWLEEVCGRQLAFAAVQARFPELVPSAVAQEFVRWLT